MQKERILAEIKRTASENGGAPLGMHRFQKETGITRDAWLGKFWRRWNDAVQEAGFTPNAPSQPVERDDLLRHLALLTREHGRFPTDADLSLAKVNGAPLPHKHRFRKLGTLPARIGLLRTFVREHPEYEDVLVLLPSGESTDPEEGPDTATVDGALYMLKLGKHFKIGKFGGAVRAKNQTAQFNEVLAKMLCHNLSVLVHEIHELGIEPAFWMPREVA
ncbi:MAG: hypothetical protein KIT84_44605 [Labilithrix sp.]|nr:hypothetical protein [Labilithrix sp.]MCW5818162.1 hypothetical protein [Labilithrix sp.]